MSAQNFAEVLFHVISRVAEVSGKGEFVDKLLTAVINSSEAEEME